jgi:23S rRNA maturation-related 3'-5' exoribonuclease YhaM
MKRIVEILFLCLSFIYGCNSNSIKEKFNTLKNIDYSEFKNMSIVNRNGIYFVTYNGATHKIKRSLFTKKVNSVERAFSSETDVLLTKEEIDSIEFKLKSFDKIKVLSLSVDKIGNVFISIPWYDRCTYYFIKLAPTNDLQKINKGHYQLLENDWYLYKECAEK